MDMQIEEVETKNKKAEIELALKEFGHELKRVREAKNLNQRQLHDITGIHYTVISELERGLYTPSLSMIRELADGLGINPHILVAAYYGIPLPEFNVGDKETLESLIQIALDYVARQNQPPPPPIGTSGPYQEPDAQAELGVKQAREIRKSRNPKNKRKPQPAPKPDTNDTDITK